MNYNAPLTQMKFLLRDVFEAERVWASMPATQDVSSDVVDAILEEGAKITREVLAPINRSGDEEGVHWSKEGVTTPKGFKEAWKTYAEGGWIGLGGEPAYGGQGMPKMLTVLFEEMLYASNCSFALYSVLTSGAALAINAHGSEQLKQTYLPKMYSGEWSGAMCLTEPHAGTDLGIIRTRAIDNKDGTYSITGTKIFITGGEQDLTKNIIHLVLAKLPDAPAGPKGISLFLVPKVIVKADGSLGARNKVSCGSTEHKMGIHASATCVMNFDGATGYLVGEINKGLAAMFTMMNYERLSIGLQGLGCSEMSYQNAVAYAQERLQSRAATGAVNPQKEADPIIVHGDVRRMLLTMRAYIDGSRAFSLYTGMQLDLAKFHPDAALRKKAEDLVALLTPVAKAFISDKGFDSCVLGQQVYGGHGYIRDNGQEQLLRDARIAQIYEGTNGVQAQDLVKRKVIANNGAFVTLFLNDVRASLSSATHTEASVIAALSGAIRLLEQATDRLLKAAGTDPDYAGIVSVDYLHLFGLVTFGWLWLQVADKAVALRDNMASAKTTVDSAFLDAQLVTAHFYFERLLPLADSHAHSIQSATSSLMTLSARHFSR